MNISSLYSYNTAFSLINALYPTSSVSSVSGISGLSGLSSVLHPAGVETSISSLGSLLSGVDTLKSSSASLAALKGFDARAVASSNAKVATASAGAGTAVGTYAVEVTQLAQAQTLTTAAQASSLSRIGNSASTLTFQFASGETRELALGGTNNTLAGIAATINAAGIGVKAQVINSSSGYQLGLSGQSGAANAFTIGVSGNSAMAELLAYPPGGGSGPALTTQAQNAEGLIDGTAFVASTNAVSTATPGLALNLVATGKASLSVAPDAAITKTLTSFLDAYSAVQNTLSTLGTENTTLGWSVSYLRSQLSSALGSDESLARIGITTNPNGTLALNTQSFTAALGESPTTVANILNSEGTGVAARVKSLTEGTLSPTNLLQYALPSMAYSSLPGASEQSWQHTYLSQLGVFDSTNTSSNYSSLLLNQLLNTSSTNSSNPFGTSNSSTGNQFLLSLLDQQASNARILSASFG